MLRRASQEPDSHRDRATITLRERASRRMNPSPKISLVPTANVRRNRFRRQHARQNQRVEITLMIRAKNVRAALGQFFDAATFRSKRSSATI